jgi:predicted DNA-binding transcriptional regulator AlpA
MMKNRPIDERVDAAAAGRFVDMPSDTELTTAPSKPYQARAPPILAYSIKEFCKAVGISVSYFYELKHANLAPRTIKLGARQIISVEEAQAWCKERTEASQFQPSITARSERE